MITLYKKNKDGSIQLWSGWVYGNKIYYEFGQLDGKLQVTSRKATPKNVGKVNETTAEEQAHLELESKVQKQRDAGYFDTVEEAQTTQIYQPMLAKKYSDTYVDWNNAYIQPKLDGTRALLIGDKFISRQGKHYHVMNWLSKKFREQLPENIVLDGELYNHDFTFQQIISAVKKDRDMTYEIQYYCYDLIDLNKPDLSFKERLELLVDYSLSSLMNISEFMLVPTLTIHDELDLVNFHTENIEYNFEGSIIRNGRGQYIWGKRSSDLLKYKDWQDDEFEITGFSVGTGNHSGCVIWECITPEGRLFNAVPKATLEERVQMLNDAHSYMGKLATVKFFEYTDDNIPRFPNVIQYRNKDGSEFII